MLEFISSVLFYSCVVCGVSAILNMNKFIFLIAFLDGFTLYYYMNAFVTNSITMGVLAVLLSLVFLITGFHVIYKLPSTMIRFDFLKQSGVIALFFINSMTLITWVTKCLK